MLKKCFRASIYNLRIILEGSPENSLPIVGPELRSIVDDAFGGGITSLKDNPDIYVERCSDSSHYFFGSLGKDRDMSKDEFARKRINAKMRAGQIDVGTNIEFFTYFMIDYKTGNVIILHIPKTPSIPLAFKHHFLNLDKVRSARVVSSMINARKKLKTWNNIDGLEIITTDNLTEKIKGLNTATNIKKAFMTHGYKSTKMNINIKFEKFELTDDLIDQIEAIQVEEYTDEFQDQYILHGINDNGRRDHYNLANSILSESFTVDYSGDPGSLEESIKSKMIHILSLTVD